MVFSEIKARAGFSGMLKSEALRAALGKNLDKTIMGEPFNRFAPNGFDIERSEFYSNFEKLIAYPDLQTSCKSKLLRSSK